MNTAKKIIIPCLIILALIAIPLTGCPKPLLTKWEAIEILVKEIIPPAADDTRVSAVMPSQMLEKGDVVTSEDGSRYPITRKTWFIYIDDSPQAFFGHPTRYVFIDARSGSYDIYPESWPPEINDYSMWNTSDVGRGHLIELWSVLGMPDPITPTANTNPLGDYGDAPDGQDAYYGVLGRYPTLYNTTNSQFGRPGGHTLNTGQETLGFNVSDEVDANDPQDPDGMPNLVDADSDERIYVITELTQARLAFTVAVSTGAPDLTRHANALIDFDQSGHWSSGPAGVEWVTVNQEVKVKPGTSDTVMTPLFAWGNQSPLVWPVWLRLALTRAEVDESLFANSGGWDGSGQFEYGEFEDFAAYLTDFPPPNGNGNGEPPPPNGNGDPPPPGPKKGPCGYDINYYVLIINAGDCAKHINDGTPIAQSASSSMTSTAQAQGYTPVGNLGPGNNSEADMAQAFENLRAKVKCGDYVLIYICGHGYSDAKRKGGGIQIYDPTGNKTDEVLTPSELADLLGKIKACPDLECETPHVCCHVSVILESCYAGNFNVPGVTGPGRAVIGTSNDTQSAGIYPGGGVYTAGLVHDMKDPDSDKTDPPDGVDPMEANTSADQAVQNSPLSKARGQQTWSNNQWCECKCPCKPEIDVEKWVWDPRYFGDEASLGWVDSINAFPGDQVIFRIDIESSGKCRGIAEVELVDFLPDCLEYGGEAVFYLGEEAYDGTPNNISQVEGGLELFWDFKGLGILEPGESIVIEYIAYAQDWGDNVNVAYGSACCSEDTSVGVNDQDDATVVVVPPAEDLITGYVDFSAQSHFVDADTCESFFDIFFVVEDITGGDFPLTNVTLNVNGEPAYDSGVIDEAIVERHVGPTQGDCGDVIDVELVAMSLASPDPIVLGSQSYVLPTPTVETVLSIELAVYVLCHYLNDVCQGCEVTYTLTAEDLTGGEMPVTGVELFVNGLPFYSSGPISETSFGISTAPMAAGCADIIDVEMVALNLIGLEANISESFDTSDHDVIEIE